MLASLPGYSSEKQEKVTASPEKEKSWWEKTKDFVKDNIIDPVNEKIVQPYVVPYVEQRVEGVKEVAAWANEKVYEPYIKPYVEPVVQKAKKVVDDVKKAGEKALLWIDQHQAEVALGIGVAVGIAAIILSGGLAVPLVAAAWVAGAAVVAAGTVAVGTIALNLHYEREWNENLITNMVLSGLSAAVISGGWFLFQGAIAAAGPFCAANPSICGRIEPILNAVDSGEQLWLSAKLGYQNWIGDQAGAADTALELQMEQMDGGMPGNSILKDVGEETLEKVAKYGDEALALVVLYGDDAAEIIATYGDDGIAILMKYGDDAIDLINDHGLAAIKVLQSVDLAHADELFEVLDDDVLDYAIQQGPDAIDALSRWDKKDLIKYGPELALRAEKDGKALAAVKKLISLGPIDPKHLTKEQKELVDVIAENSTQYGDEGQIVLGKWVDQGGGFVQVAKDTGSVHYNPHPDIWDMMGELGGENQSEVAWLVNQRVIQNGIEKGKPFEYTLNGIAGDAIDNEKAAVRAIFSGKTDVEVMKALESKYMPIRMKELQELKKAGYEFVFDEINNSYILALP